MGNLLWPGMKKNVFLERIGNKKSINNWYPCDIVHCTAAVEKNSQKSRTLHLLGYQVIIIHHRKISDGARNYEFKWEGWNC